MRNNDLELTLKAPQEYAQYWTRENYASAPKAYPPTQHDYRSVFACDRDRIMYCSAFRRLTSKTQVFKFGVSDGLRTRLTHTLEVSQIARTIAEQLSLDVTLTEAIALGHDLGHTPFGHVGERTLNLFSQGQDKKIQIFQEDLFASGNLGFKHNLQSVRLLIEYSQNVKYSNFVLYGIREHSKRFWEEETDVGFYNIYDQYCSYYEPDTCYPSWSFEAFVVKWADEIAQRHHDIEDAYLQKILTPKEIFDKVCSLYDIVKDKSMEAKYNRLVKSCNDNAHDSFSHSLSSFVVDAYVTIIIHEFTRVLTHFSNIHNITNQDDFSKKYLSISETEIQKIMSLEGTKLYELDKELGKSLKYAIVDSFEVQRLDGKGAYIIRKLLRAYLSNPQQLPNNYIDRLFKVEFDRLLLDDDKNTIITFLQLKFKKLYKDNMLSWKNYEYREALRLIFDDSTMKKIILPPLLRIAFDYISGMTDTYALQQFNELY